jgi:hypothetical protein
MRDMVSLSSLTSEMIPANERNFFLETTSSSLESVNSLFSVAPVVFATTR